MTAPLSSPLSRSKKALLLAAGTLAFAMPVQRATAAPLPADPAQIKRQAAEFVRSYGAFTPGVFARSHLTGRWASAICMEIAGLTPAQEMAVRARIEEVVKTVELNVAPEGCSPNVTIAFTTDPQRTLDSLVQQAPLILGDPTSDTRKVKTITRPIQAWYVTNGGSFAENDRKAGTEGLKVDVVWQNYQDPTVNTAPPSAYGWGGTASPPNMNNAYPVGSPRGSDSRIPGGGPELPSGRLFNYVLVIVDLSRAEPKTKTLGLLSDYVAMLALSQPRDLGQCNVLPSVTDLFATCPGRPAPDGLTAADAAYLGALYMQPGSSLEARIAAGMAQMLAGDQVASR